MAKIVDLNFNPDDRTLRQFGVIAVFAFGALAACAYYEVMMFAHGLGNARLTVAGALAGVGVLSLLMGLVYPRGNRVIFVGLSVLAYPIGFVLSHIILGVVFFGVIAPIGVLLRLMGKSPLARSYDPKATTYWSKGRPVRDQQSYFKQY